MAQSNPPLPEGTDAIIEGAGAGNEPEIDTLTDDVDGGSGGRGEVGGGKLVGAGEGGVRQGDTGTGASGSTAQGGSGQGSRGQGASSQSGSSQGGSSQSGQAAGSQGGTGQGSGTSWAEGGGAFFERFADLKTQGYDQARAYAVQGKDKATGALDELLRTINDAADQIDSKVGNQYGDYARRAATGIADFNEALKGKDVDDLFNEARSLIARAPAVAVGTAAALGFVVARLAKAGMPDPAGAPHTSKPGDTHATKS